MITFFVGDFLPKQNSGQKKISFVKWKPLAFVRFPGDIVSMVTLFDVYFSIWRSCFEDYNFRPCFSRATARLCLTEPTCMYNEIFV